MKSELDEAKIMTIQRMVAHMFGLSVEGLSARRKDRAITSPRQIAMYVARQETSATLADIGNLFGGKHHSTVLHSIERVETLRRTDETIDQTIEVLRANLRSG